MVTLVTVAWLALATLPPRPPLPQPGNAVLLGLAAAALGFVLLKLAADVDGLARGAWATIVLAVAFAATRVAATFRRAPAVSPS